MKVILRERDYGECHTCIPMILCGGRRERGQLHLFQVLCEVPYNSITFKQCKTAKKSVNVLVTYCCVMNYPPKLVNGLKQ